MDFFAKPVTGIVLGAGWHGKVYSSFSKRRPERWKVVGVAEPREWHRNDLQSTYNIPAENVFTDWRQVLDRPKMADVALITMQDALHVEPAVELARKGYAVLLEKPMAQDVEGCLRIAQAVKANGTIFGVCHVMRYILATRMLKEIIDSGQIGDIVNIQHFEPVGYWHQGHSFVRGNWRSQKESNFMLMTKSCHDVDWLRYIMGVKCLSVSSFGGLKYFKKSGKPLPAGDAKRCVECQYEPKCPYSAIKLYIKDCLEKGNTSWPVNTLEPEPTVENIMADLQTSPYGRCVFECDNDVVDNQVVNMLFEGQRTVSFTMTAFNRSDFRKTRIFGTLGELFCDGHVIEHFDFLTEKKTITEIPPDVGDHAGGDYRLMLAFTAAVARGDQKLIQSGIDETLESHLIVFAAEQARLEKRVVDIQQVLDFDIKPC
jgi:predicted dehydrogenase